MLDLGNEGNDLGGDLISTGISWEEALAAPKGKILFDEFDEGLRFIVMRGPAALCAYVGIPLDHPLAGQSYDNLPVRAHGGLTFASEGTDHWPAGLFWYGWDYAHCNDANFYSDEIPSLAQRPADKKWTVDEVVADSWETLYDFRHLLKLAEAIARKVNERKSA